LPTRARDARASRKRDPAEEVAIVADAARRRLLAGHSRLLRYADLEDCYSQATLELIAQARAGTLRVSSRAHLGNTLALRFASRVTDRRRALRGRSPAQALLDSAISMGGAGSGAVEVEDPKADIELRMRLRDRLRSLERAAQGLSDDQRLLLACQVGLGMGAGEFCRRFGWSHEKYRKVGQRGRKRLLILLEGLEAGEADTPRSLGVIAPPVEMQRGQSDGVPVEGQSRGKR
jgi:DNA-directed RNA polymerase specialized sigma24 family protein